MVIRQSIVWHDTPNSMMTVTGPDCTTLAEARTTALESAKHFGYTAPRWWQYWRWSDLDYERLPA